MGSSVMFLYNLAKKPSIAYLWLLVPIAFYLVINDYNFCINLFVYEQASEINKQFVDKLVSVINVYNLVSITAYILMPLIALYYNKQRIVYPAKKAKHSFYMTSMFLMDIFVLQFFLMMPCSVINVENISLLKIPKQYFDLNVYKPYALIALLVSVPILIYNTDFLASFIVRTSDIAKKNMVINQNTKLLFHTYKNQFLSIKNMILIARENFNTNPDFTLNLMDKIQESSQSSMSKITTIIECLGNFDVMASYEKVEDLINETLSEIYIPNEIKIVKIIEKDMGNMKISKMHFITMLENIINNAVEALVNSEQKSPEIKIEAFKENNYENIVIMDNGTGINKNDINKIFSPFYSTKSGSNNYGLGLTYVKKVVDAHHGRIYIESIPNKYTIFQILIPKTNKKRERK